MQQKLSVLVLAVCLAAVASAGNTELEKPWYDYSWLSSNPHLFYYAGHDIWLDVQDMQAWAITMQKTINSLELSTVQSGWIEDAQTKKYVLDAKAAEGRCDANYNTCMQAVDSAYKSIEPGCYLFRWCVAPELANAWFSHQACLSYDANWKTTMSNSVDALSRSIDLMDNSLKKANRSFAEAVAMGLCDYDYHGEAKAACMNVSGAFSSLNSGSVEGSYGKYNIILSKKEEIQRETRTYLPNMENLSTAIKLIWMDNGALDTLEWMGVEAEASKARAKNEFSVYDANISMTDAAVNALLQRLEGEKPTLITKAALSGNIAGAKATGTIAERYAKLSAESRNASSSHELAHKYFVMSGVQGYHKNAINELRRAERSYRGILTGLNTLEIDAKTVVEQQKNDAEAGIRAAETALSSEPSTGTARSFLDAARGRLGNGTSARTLGEQFVLYSQAENYARTAKMNIGGSVFANDTGRAAVEAALRQLLNNAEKDRLLFPGDKSEFAALKGQTEVWVLERMKNLSAGIVARAEGRYGYLAQWRQELRKRIQLADGEVDDQLTDMERAEAGMFDANGALSYPDAIGSLLKLENTYRKVDAVVNISMVNITATAMHKSASVFIDEVRLDSSSNITATILLENKNAYGANKVPVKVPVQELGLGTWLRYSDMKCGMENVSSMFFDGRENMVLVLNAVRSYSVYWTVFEKEKVLARTVKGRTIVHGLGDGSARITSATEFELELDTSAFRPRAGMKNIMIDGKETYTLLKKGVHRLDASYSISDAYSYSTENIKSLQLGLNSRMEYEAVLLPKIDLDTVIIFINTDSEEKTSNVNAYSLTGESGERPKQLAPGRYSAVFRGLAANRTSRIFISYNIANTSDYAISKLNELENGNHSTAVSAVLREAKEAANESNWNAALEKIKKAEEMIHKEKTENDKNRKKVLELEKTVNDELGQLKKAIAGAGSANASSIIGKLSARASELEHVLNGSSGMAPADAVAELGKIDNKWLEKEVSAFRKSAYKEYNELKARFSGAGNLTTPQEFLELEAVMNTLEADGRAVHIPEILKRLEGAKTTVLLQEQTQQTKGRSLQGSFEETKKELKALLGSYGKLAAAAKGTEMEGIFMYDTGQIDSEIKTTEKLLAKNDFQAAEAGMARLNTTKNSLRMLLDSLKVESEGKLKTAEQMLTDARPLLQQDATRAFEKKIDAMKGMVAAGNYVAALKAGNLIVTELQNAQVEDGGMLLVLSAAVIAVIVLSAAYLYKQWSDRKDNGNDIIRKLKKAE